MTTKRREIIKRIKRILQLPILPLLFITQRIILFQLARYANKLSLSIQERRRERKLFLLNTKISKYIKYLLKKDTQNINNSNSDNFNTKLTKKRQSLQKKSQKISKPVQHDIQKKVKSFVSSTLSHLRYPLYHIISKPTWKKWNVPPKNPKTLNNKKTVENQKNVDKSLQSLTRVLNKVKENQSPKNRIPRVKQYNHTQSEIVPVIETKTIKQNEQKKKRTNKLNQRQILEGKRTIKPTNRFMYSEHSRF